jgi:hypothetical protein
MLSQNDRHPVGAVSFVDKGTEKVLDVLQERGGLNPAPWRPATTVATRWRSARIPRRLERREARFLLFAPGSRSAVLFEKPDDSSNSTSGLGRVIKLAR